MTQLKADSPDAAAIKALIQSFFDRVNDNDPQGLQKLFVPNANLTIIRQDPPRSPPEDSAWRALPLPTRGDGEEKLTVVLRISIESFIKMIEDGEKKRKGKPDGPEVDERPDLDMTEVRVDGLFAVAWCPFRVTFDGVLHHWGNFVYTFGKVGEDGGWLFEDLTQNYRRTPGWEGSASEFV